MANKNYSADQIQVLEGLEPVRKRPGMYIGSTAREGLHHLVTEIVNNSMDEAMGGFGDTIKVEFFKDGSVAIYDNGRGFPYQIKEGYGVSALELVATKLHAGGKFSEDGGYKVSSGLHGVGLSVVNALSEWCRIVVKDEDRYVIQEFQNGGKVVRPVEDIDFKNPTKINGAEWNLNTEDWTGDSGSIVHFKPDATIFETTDFKFDFFLGQIRDYAYLTAGIKFQLIDHREDKEHTFYFEGGIKTFLKALNRNKTVMHQNPFYVHKQLDNVEVEVALQYTDGFAENVLTYANHVKTMEGGTHLTGFKAALTKVINDYARSSGILKEKEPSLSGDDIREGLTAIVSVKLPSSDLQYEGQTKGKLGNSHVRPAVESAVKDALETFLEENPRDAKGIIEKNVLALKARIAAKAARDTVIRKSALDGSGVLPGKLSDCSEKNANRTELYIVEGDSAGGTAKAARDREYQAILPLFGKPLNTERARLDKVVSFEKFNWLIVAIGAGIGETFEPSRVRYNKIIVMADADSDGMHIMTLYLTFFYRHMPELIEHGNIYIAVPPLYKATWGKNKKYLFDDQERNAFLNTAEGPKAMIQRFKGLGEMNAIELWETTMNPQTRKLKKITVDDASAADEVFTNLMGSEVPPRKKFIQTHAKQANIDIT